MIPRRLTLAYQPIHYIRDRWTPALTLIQKPRPNCPECGGCGVIYYDPDCISEEPCPCAPEDPLLELRLPRMTNPHYRAHRRQERRAAARKRQIA